MKTIIAIIIIVGIYYMITSQPECNYDSSYVGANEITCDCHAANYANFDKYYRFIGTQPTIKETINGNYMYGKK